MIKEIFPEDDLDNWEITYEEFRSEDG